MTSFIYELKRRNVIRVSATYLVVSWLLLQVGDVIFSALKLDDSAQALLLAMLALGFIPAVILSWIYELTPGGIKQDSEVGANEAANTLTSKRLNYITITAILILIPMLIWSKNDNASSTKSTEIAVKSESGKASEFGGTSIAVLPFQDMSSAGDQEYFGDGIAEELLNSLASTEGLQVAASTSSFKFRNANVDIPEIGLALNVKTVLEGSIRKVGDQVRISAQLINVDDGYHLWSQTYDRKLDNIFAVQDEIALAIVDALKLKLNLKKEIRQDINPQAYDFYLRGRNSAHTINKKSQLTAVDFFEKAIAIDPQFADAYAGIASSWIWLEDYGGFASEYAFPQMETAARKALSLDSSSPEALMAMGLYYYTQLDDAVMGKTLFEYALKENPSLVEIYTHYADVLLAMNQPQESLHYLLEALKVDPLSSFYRARYIKALSAENRTEEAQQQLDIIFADDPDDTYGLEELGNLYRYQGNTPKSIDAYTKVHNLRPGDPFSASQMAKSLEVLGLSELSNYWARQARLRGENNRWELNSRFVIAAIRADWQAMLRVADIKATSDVDVGDSWRGFALLNLEQYDEARSAFERSLKTINMQLSKRFKTENLYALFGMVLLDDIQNRTNTYYDYTKTFFVTRNKGNGIVIAQSFDARLGLACITMLDKSMSLKVKVDKAMGLLDEAVDKGFLNAAWINNLHCFDAIRESPPLLDIIRRIEKTKEQQRNIIKAQQ